MAIGEEKVMIFHSKVMKPQKPEPGKKGAICKKTPIAGGVKTMVSCGFSL